MPRVPTAEGFGVLPTIRSGGARPVLSVEQAAQPGRQMEARGAQMAQLGGQLGEYVQQQQEKVNKVRFNDAYNQALSEANRLKDEMSKYEGAEAVSGINGRSLRSHYQDEIRKSLGTIANGLAAPAVKENFALVAADIENKFLREADSWEVAQGQVYADRVRDATVLSSFDAIAAEPKNEDVVALNIARAKDALRDKFEDAGYSGENLKQQMSMALGKSHNAIITTLLEDDDLESAQAYFEAHKDDYLALDAKDVPALFAQKEAELRRKRYESFSLGITQDTVRPADLQAAYENGELDDGEYNALLVQSANAAARKEAERKAKASEWRDQNYAIMQVGINDGTMSRADADLALEKGMVTYSQWSSLARMGTEKTAAARSMGEFLNNVTLGVPVDPNSADMKRGANEYFKQTGAADLLKSMNPQDFQRGMQATTTMAVDAGIVPEAAVTTLRGLKASGTPQQQMFAIRAIGELYNMQPNATDAAFNSGEVAEAISYQFKLNAGVDAPTAYAAILKEREARNEPAGATSLTKARVAEARKLAGEFDTKAALKTPDRGGFLGMFKQNEISGGALAEQQILIDYQQSFQTYYVQHGDAELAKKQADAVVQRTVGVSRANGGKVMLHPPERYYPDTGKDWMRDTLVTAVSETLGSEIRARDIELVSDAQTARDVRDGSMPTYAVKVKTGDAEQIMPMRWSFDAEAADQQAKERAAAARKAKAGSARETAAREAETTADALEGTFIPTSLMTSEQVERVKQAQKDARAQADTLRQRAEAE